MALNLSHLGHLVVVTVTLLLTVKSIESTSTKCGSTISLRSFTLTSPNDVPPVCSYKIKAITSKICQIKLEFNSFSLAPPTFQPYSRCLTDKMSSENFELCGENSGQHGKNKLFTVMRSI